MPFQAARSEPEKDVRRGLASLWPRGAAAKTLRSASPATADDATRFFRPLLRASTPVLTICDDGAKFGEAIRVRKKEFVIGRTDGDLTIPHDDQMSSCHAALRQTVVRDQVRWTLADLNSTNGTFVRVAHAVLEDGSEFLLGHTRLRFENQSDSHNAGSAPASVAENCTQPWQQPVANNRTPAVVELTNDKSRCHLLLNKPEVWLGKDASHCHLVLPADPFISARHARIRCDKEGRWILENNKSVNGVWLRVEQIVLKKSCRFMLGEQLFMFQVP